MVSWSPRMGLLVAFPLFLERLPSLQPRESSEERVIRSIPITVSSRNIGASGTMHLSAGSRLQVSSLAAQHVGLVLPTVFVAPTTITRRHMEYQTTISVSDLGRGG